MTAVAAAVILSPHKDRVLLVRKGKSSADAGQWEFPGGKIHAGESLREGLIREIHEELGVQVDPANEIICCRSGAFEIHFILCPPVHESLHLYEHSRAIWAAPHDLSRYALLQADAAACPAIRAALRGISQTTFQETTWKN
ncbi:MAG: NUDIX domain-containing protein [Fibrobacterota bacterium]